VTLPELLVEVDFDNDGSWVDVAEYHKSGSIERGVSRHDGVYPRAEAGRATVELNNHDARFDPTNLDGPYVADGRTQVQPRRPCRIRAALGGSFVSAYAAAVTEDSPVGYWRLGESSGPTAVDETASNDGTYTGGPVLGQSGAIADDPDTAVLFDGTDDCVVVDDDPALDVGDTFTLEAWIKRGSIGGEQAILSKGPGSFLFWFVDTGTLRLTRQDVAHVVDSTAAITDTDTWHHVAATKDGSTVLLYIDGVDVTGSVTDSTMVDTAHPLNIARRSNTENIEFPGLIDEVAVYDSALSGARIAAHYAASGLELSDAVEYPLWRGFVERWRPAFGLGGKDAIVTLTGVDGTTIFGNYNGDEQAPQGAGEDSGARATRIADLVGWPGGLRDIATGLVDLQATTLAQPARTELLLAADSELGETYFGADGSLVFRNRDWIEETRSAESQATFGDGEGELPYSDVTLAHDDLLIRNRVRISRTGGVAVVAEDGDSIAEYGVKGYSRLDLIHQTDGESLDVRDWILAVYGDVEPRIETLTINPQAAPADTWPQALGRELGDRITVLVRPPGRETAIERDCIIRGIEHLWTQDTWRTRWALQDAARLEEGAGILGQERVMIFGNADFGRGRFTEIPE
jgi:hypothetical protein